MNLRFDCFGWNNCSLTEPTPCKTTYFLEKPEEESSIAGIGFGKTDTGAPAESRLHVRVCGPRTLIGRRARCCARSAEVAE